jgi:hypothetical protein
MTIDLRYNPGKNYFLSALVHPLIQSKPTLETSPSPNKKTNSFCRFSASQTPANTCAIRNDYKKSGNCQNILQGKLYPNKKESQA